MRIGDNGVSRFSYPGTLAMLALALAFPISLMVFNPTLMFERGWEQYVGTGIYFWAVLTLGRELLRIWANDRVFDSAPQLLRQATGQEPSKLDASDVRMLPARLVQLSSFGEGSSVPTVDQLMEINREASGLDQEHASGRFTLTRYILYLLPVIGFIGTVEGISKALMNISKVLPMVKNLDGFMSNLTSVTSALQVAFDSTLLALFLSAALMLVQTLVFRRSEDLLARIDRWIVSNVLPKMGVSSALDRNDTAQRDLAAIVDRFVTAIDRMPVSLAGFERGAEAIARIGSDLDSLGTASSTLQRGVATLSRIEAMLTTQIPASQQLHEIQRGIERNCEAVEALANSLTTAYERSNRTSQEHLARTMQSLKDALDMLNVSMEQGNSLYRSIVRQMFRNESKGFTVTTEDAA